MKSKKMQKKEEKMFSVSQLDCKFRQQKPRSTFDLCLFLQTNLFTLFCSYSFCFYFSFLGQKQTYSSIYLCLSSSLLVLSIWTWQTQMFGLCCFRCWTANCYAIDLQLPIPRADVRSFAFFIFFFFFFYFKSISSKKRKTFQKEKKIDWQFALSQCWPSRRKRTPALCVPRSRPVSSV